MKLDCEVGRLVRLLPKFETSLRLLTSAVQSDNSWLELSLLRPSDLIGAPEEALERLPDEGQRLLDLHLRLLDLHLVDTREVLRPECCDGANTTCGLANDGCSPSELPSRCARRRREVAELAVRLGGAALNVRQST